MDERRFIDLVSVGKKTVEDFELLGIHTMEDLAKASPEKMFTELCGTAGARVDICCLDVFCAAVAQAKNPKLPAEQSKWWYYSRLRKQKEKKLKAKEKRLKKKKTL